jgi:hypothetical protein
VIIDLPLRAHIYLACFSCFTSSCTLAVHARLETQHAGQCIAPEVHAPADNSVPSSDLSTKRAKNYCDSGITWDRSPVEVEVGT